MSSALNAIELLLVCCVDTQNVLPTVTDDDVVLLLTAGRRRIRDPTKTRCAESSITGS